MIDEMVSWRFATLAVIALGGRAYAQRAEADAEFQRGRTLMLQGKVVSVGQPADLEDELSSAYLGG